MKCLPVSRRNSISGRPRSQSALFRSRAALRALERQEPLELAQDALGVPVDLLQGEHRALVPLAARIAHHAGAAADQRDRRVALPLEPGHAHHRHQASHVERVRGRIEADVGRDRALAEPLGESGRSLLDEAAVGQQLEKVAHSGVSYPLETCPATG